MMAAGKMRHDGGDAIIIDATTLGITHEIK